MENKKALDIVVFPWLAFGHMIPFLELSKHLAKKGHHISYVSTPRNLERLLPKIPKNLLPFIKLVPIPLPRDGVLPPKAEASSDMPFDDVELLKKAYDGLKEPLASILEGATPIDWIIYDYPCYWLPPIADRLGVRKAFLSLMNGWSSASFGPSSNMIKDGAGTWSKPESLTGRLEWVPFQNNVVYRFHEAKKSLSAARKNASGVSDMFRGGCSVCDCDVFAIRSSRELEAEYLQLLEKLHRKPVVPVGLLPTSVDEDQMANSDTWHSIKDWLDKHTNESVVYAALGSELGPSQDVVNALALGLELSRLPFFWALRNHAGRPQELPDGFKKQTRDQGLVWTSWVPQAQILSHNSVGAFLTHCGWSSIIEGLQFGKPLIMLPFVLDQGLNARVMEAKKVGFEIPRNNQDGSFDKNSVAQSLKVMCEDVFGKIYRDEAKKMSRMVADENLHNQYIEEFEAYLYRNRPISEA
ncbi:putative UDP-rhamnose:rhamnosyltransferase 1 [Amaranthus tricolor]|uniref:putative UDP-rhamnose:rhamnosyltransferase 1 n=1 Tax=Amaranthus tricolor TaxID=29722 RepID=UPI00258FF339|nr:putative UDP-rhamnose:rhamnosyltransferase 1 [Amaranthus tricolor]